MSARKFTSAKQLISLWIDFNEEIRKNDFASVPTQTNFCRWLAEHFDVCDRRTIYNALNKYFPTLKKDFERIQSDTIAEGAMLGRYQSTMSIFALKNWCRWSDAPRDEEQENAGMTEALIQGLMQ